MESGLLRVKKKLSLLNNEVITYERHDFVHIDGRTVTVWYRSIADLFIFYFKKLEVSLLVNVEKIEVCLGGDHGKGSYIYLAIVIIRYNDGKVVYRLELKLGEINEEKDKIEFIQELLE